MSQIVIPYSAQPRQQVFHKSYADEILYGGAAGGGKSEAILFDALANAMAHRDCRIIIFRRTFPDLKRSLILRSQMVFPKQLARYNQSDKVWTFYETGATIEFAYWDNDANYMNYQGAEYDFIYWDELTQFKEKWYVYMLSRLRGKTPINRQVKSASNPGGVGHGWVKGRFIDPKEPEEVWQPELTEAERQAGVEKALSRCFIPASVYDNHALLANDPQYLARLASLPEDERRALLEGDWEVFAGQYFTSFRKDKHVIEPFQVPHYWRRYRSIDWGFNDHCAVYWHAVDGEGRDYTYRELYINETLASDVAKEIVRLSFMKDENGKEVPENIEYTVASPDMWQKRGIAVKNNNNEIVGQSIAEDFMHNGVPLIRADNSRVIGWQRMKERMEDAADGTPHWVIFSNCKNLVRTIPLMVRDDKHVEDIADGVEDHACESVRYYHMSRPRKAKPQDADMTTIQRHKKLLITKRKNKQKRIV